MNIVEKLAEYSLVAHINAPLDPADANELAMALQKGGVCAAEVNMGIENSGSIITVLCRRGLFTGAYITDSTQICHIPSGCAAWISYSDGALLPAGASIPCIPRVGDNAQLFLAVTEENMQAVFASNEKNPDTVFFLDLFSNAISLRDWDAVTSVCKRAVKAMLGMYLHHVGINSPDLSSCRQTVDDLSANFGLCRGKESPTAIFVDSAFEVMKSPGPGMHGHICMRVACIHRAINYLRSTGIRFNENSRQYNAEGELFVIYFEEQIAGFAYHLIEA